MIKSATAIILLLSLCLCSKGLAQEGSIATYRLMFTSSWSASTHPDSFPPNPHYSPLKAATHDSTVSFWSEGTLASPGIESMAETGNNTTLDSEMNTEQAAGTVQFIIEGPGLNDSPGNADFTFNVSTSHPRFTVVSMIAPSPDWFVGLTGVDLFVNENWLDTLSVVAYVYDAGTDDGISYTSADAEAMPHHNIERIEGFPFEVGGEVVPAGEFELTLLSVVATEPASSLETGTGPAYPNPAVDIAYLPVRFIHPQKITVELFDLLGRQVREVFMRLPAGTHTIQLETDNLSPGMYLYRVNTIDFIEKGSIVVVR